jgi:hypothetical protein
MSVAGLLICDVWRSQEELDNFVETRVGPALQEAGLNQNRPVLLDA